MELYIISIIKVNTFVIAGGNAIVAPILCHREPSQMAWRSSHNKVARSRVRALFTGLLRCARNDKSGVAAA